MSSLATARLTGWTVIAVSIAVLLVFAGLRLPNMLAESSGVFDARYARHVLVALLHIVPGLVFVTLAPVQFVSYVRQRYPAVHRWMGRILVGCGAVSGLFALVAAFRLPAFGGAVTISATLIFGAIFLFSLGRGVWHVRRWEVAQHREWMLRAFALGLGAATIRLFIGVSEAAGLAFEQVFGVAFWLGFLTNLVIAEAWISITRVHPGTTRGHASAPPR
jgi:hypothetical protein